MFENVNSTNNQPAPDTAVLNTNPARENNVQFDQGEILKGVVLDIKPDGMISLLVKNSTINAKSEIPATPGQHLYLLVDSFKGGQTHLKLVASQDSAGSDDHILSSALRSIGAPSNPDTILTAHRLLQHNLPVNLQNITEIAAAANTVGAVNAHNIEAAIFALEHNIPLDKNIFPFIHKFISSDGDLSRPVRELIQLLNQAESFVRAVSSAPAQPAASGASDPHNPAAPSAANTSGSLAPAAPAVVIISGSSDTAALSAPFAHNPSDTVNAAALNPIVTGVETTLIHNAAQETSGNNGAQAAGGNTGNISRPSLATMVFSAPPQEPNPDFTVQANAALPETEPSGTETGRVDNPPAVPDSSTPASPSGEAGAALTQGAGVVLNNAAPPSFTSNPAGINRPASGIAQPDEATSVDFMELSKILRAVLDSSAGKIADSGNAVNPVLQNLIKDRALLIDNLHRIIGIFKADETLMKNPAVQRLLTRIENLQQQIAGQALFNSMANADQDVLTNSYYFSFPVEIDKHLRHCQIRIQKKTKSRLDQQENIKLAVSLDTPSLGIVIFQIDWRRQGHINLKGITETAKAGDFIEKNMSELLIRLNELGYSAVNLGVRAAVKPEEFILKPHVQEAKQDNIGRFSIDVTA